MSKRSNQDHHSSEQRRDKPKDWRDAFLEEEQPRRHSDDRSRDYRGDSSSRGSDRRRPDDRYGAESSRASDYHDRNGRGGGYRNSRDPYHRGPQREHDRERRYDPNAPPRRHGDIRDPRRDDDRRRSTISKEREEGEVGSPSKQGTSLPLASSSRPNQSPRNDIGRAERDPPNAGFQSMAIPKAPRSNAAQTRPSTSNPLEGASSNKPDESVAVIEEEKDPEQVLEERRRKREEIMAKFRANGGKPIAPSVKADPQVLGTGAESVTSAGMKTTERLGISTGSTTGATPLLRHLGTRSTGLSATATPTPGHEPTLPSTPLGNDVDLTKVADTAGGDAIPSDTKNDGAAISAADYDPIRDRADDEERRRKDAVADGVGEPVKVDAPKEEDDYEEVEISEDEDEDDDVDMFAAFDGEEKPKKKRKVTVRRRKQPGANGETVTEVIKPKKASVLDVVDNVDDTDGYYRITPGEILDDGRYQITVTLGKGMFSAVVKAKVLKAVDRERRQDVVGKEVAIKVIRSQESMYVAGRKEAQILKKLNEADPEDKKHIVRMEHLFEHRGHLCIVTESLSMNLRDVIKRFGKDVGLNMRAVRAYAHQMFLALSLMRKCSIVHADIKPDNILVSENKAVLKVCDLGSASDVSEGDITPYLVSRFYRAPEIILGLPYDTAIDIWSVGCTLYELYTGKILFPGRSNNHMLLLMMEVKGKLNHRMIKKATFGEMHFDESMNFISIEQDKITKQDVAKTLVLSKATRDLKSRLLPASSVQMKMSDEELKHLNSFIDLLDKCTQLDPVRRITPREALLHPWLTGA